MADCEAQACTSTAFLSCCPVQFVSGRAVGKRANLLPVDSAGYRGFMTSYIGTSYVTSDPRALLGLTDSTWVAVGFCRRLCGAGSYKAVNPAALLLGFLYLYHLCSEK